MTHIQFVIHLNPQILLCNVTSPGVPSSAIDFPIPGLSLPISDNISSLQTPF